MASSEPSFRYHYCAVFRRARADTRQFLLDHLMAEALIVIATIGIVLFSQRDEPLSGLVLNGLLLPLAALAVLLVGVFLWNLMWAPVRLAREGNQEAQELRSRLWSGEERIAALEEANKPKLEVEIDEARRTPDGLRQFIRLRVMNNSHQPAMACGGKLMAVKPLQQRIAMALPEPEQNLMWSSRGGGAPSHVRTINPRSPEYLDVAFTDNIVDEFYAGSIEDTPAVHDRLRQLMEDPFAYFNFVFLDYRAWPMPEGNYEVTVELSGANVATPTPISFRVVYEGGLNLYPDVVD